MAETYSCLQCGLRSNLMKRPIHTGALVVFVSNFQAASQKIASSFALQEGTCCKLHFL